MPVMDLDIEASSYGHEERGCGSFRCSCGTPVPVARDCICGMSPRVWDSPGTKLSRHHKKGEMSSPVSETKVPSVYLVPEKCSNEVCSFDRSSTEHSFDVEMSPIGAHESLFVYMSIR